MLLDHGADVDAKASNGNSPMHEACEEGNLLAPQLLLDRGASVNHLNNIRRNPLHVVCCSKYVEFEDGNLDEEDARLYNGNLEMAKVLLERGADVNAKDEDGKTPLHLISEMGILLSDEDIPYDPKRIEHQKDIVRLLLDHGADVEAKAKNGLNPILSAACNKEDTLDILFLLLRRYPRLVSLDHPCLVSDRRTAKRRRC